MSDRVNSYDKNARVPVLNTLWVWEPRNADACALVRVVEVMWNGEEWWVRAERWPQQDGGSSLNDAGRFAEAARPVVESGGLGKNMHWRQPARPDVEDGVPLSWSLEAGGRQLRRGEEVSA